MWKPPAIARSIEKAPEGSARNWSSKSFAGIGPERHGADGTKPQALRKALTLVSHSKADVVGQNLVAAVASRLEHSKAVKLLSHHSCRLTCATNFCSRGNELSFFQIRLNGSRSLISATGIKTTPLGHCQSMDSVIQAIRARHWTRFNKVSGSLAS